MTEMITDTTTEDLTVLIPYDETDDGGEHYTHIVRPTENIHITASASVSGQDIVDMARLMGEEVVALCGHRWVPDRNPDKYPACQRCFKIAEQIMANGE